MTDSVQNADVERQVLGALLVWEPALGAVFDDVKLSTTDFAFEGHRAMFAVIKGLYSEGSPVDSVTVLAGLTDRGLLSVAGGENRVMEIAEQVKAPGNVVAHARIVADNARWRARQDAGHKILEAVKTRDHGMVGEAEALLGSQESHSGVSYSPESLRMVANQIVTQEPGEVFPYPLGKLNELTDGGMRRGEFICLGGHTSMGKSVFLDQTLDALSQAGKKCHLYINEMAVQERVARALARESGVSYSLIIRNQLTDRQRDRVLGAADKALAFGLTNCAGWSADEIAGHIRANRWDVAAVDILHLIPYEETSDLERIAATFARVALQADCAVLATVHLNRNRIKSATTPRPTNADIKGASAFEQNANTVLFVHRDQNKRGIPEETGAAYFTKVRNGRLGEAWVRLNGDRYRFEPKRPDDGDPGPTPQYVPPNEKAEREPVESGLPF